MGIMGLFTWFGMRSSVTYTAQPMCLRNVAALRKRLKKHGKSRQKEDSKEYSKEGSKGSK